MFQVSITALALILSWFFAVRKPLYGVVVIILALPTFLIRWHLGSIAFNTLDLIVFGTGIFFLVTHMKEVKNLRAHRMVLIFAGLWLLAATLALIPAHDMLAALGIWKSYFLAPLVVLLLLVATVKTKKDLITILFSFSLLALMVSAVAIVQWFFPDGLPLFSGEFLAIPNPVWRDPENLRVTSVLEYPNAVALLLAPLIPLFTGLILLAQKRALKIIGMLAFFLSLASVTLAHSKGAIVGLAAALAVALILRYRTRALMALIALGILLLISVPSLGAIVATIGPGSYSAQLRFTQWREAWEMLQDNPIAGAGLAGFQEKVAPYHTRDYIEIFLYPHNIILNFWTELGLFGLAVFVALILFSLWKNTILLKNKTLVPLSIAGIASLTIIIVHGLVDVPYFKNDLAILFWFVWLWPLLIQNVFAEASQS